MRITNFQMEITFEVKAGWDFFSWVVDPQVAMLSFINCLKYFKIIFQSVWGGRVVNDILGGENGLKEGPEGRKYRA